MRLSLSMFLAFAPMTAVAQSADTVRTGIPLPVGDSTPRLPADRVEELLQWVPGGGIDADGRTSWRGRGVDLLGRSVDGVSWGGLIRNSPFVLGARPLAPTPSFNALEAAELLGDAYSVTEGSDGPGHLRFTTRAGGERWVATGSAESGAPFGPESGPGNSRFEASVGGPLPAGWRFRTAATMLGRQAAPVGIGYAAAPYYVPSGIDTSYTWEIAPGDSVNAIVQSFTATGRIPATPRTTTDLYARLDGRIGPLAVWTRYLRASEGQRDFSYEDVANPAQSFGQDGRTQDFAVGGTFPAIAGWKLGGHLSWQEERSQSGPVDPLQQVDTRNPALGLLVDGPGLLYTLESFPVDEELLWNYRANIPNSRRSPYDLENSDQYRQVDNYRNNIYGVVGFTESGAANGLVKLYRDRRIGVAINATGDLGGAGQVTVGLEHQRHDMQSYRHALTSQASSDVWLAKPVTEALFAEWTTRGPHWNITTGARFDRFDTKARRPRDFPRIRSAWGYDSTDREGWWEALSVADQAHTALSARISARGEVSPGVWLRGHVGRFARTPDLGVQLGGINTDLSITNYQQQFGTDYGHELTDVMGIGISQQTATAGLDAELLQIRYTKIPLARLVTLFDPVKAQNNDVVLVQLYTGSTVTSATLGGHVVISPAWTLRGTMTHYFTSEPIGPFQVERGPDALRPNTVTVLAEFRAPEGGMLGGLGAVVGIRRATSLTRTVEPEGDPYDPYDPFDYYNSIRSEEIPAWTSIDLRVTRTLSFGGQELTLFFDGRNLLNAENLVRSFMSGNATSSTVSEQHRFTADSALWAREASNNGVYNNGDIEMTFGRAGCGTWTGYDSNLNPPNCAYLLNAEAAFGDGDGIFTLSEQRAASLAYYRTAYGRGAFNGPPREIRIGARLRI